MATACLFWLIVGFLLLVLLRKEHYCFCLFSFGEGIDRNGGGVVKGEGGGAGFFLFLSSYSLLFLSHFFCGVGGWFESGVGG